MKLHFKNRIAFYYMIATAVIMLMVFGIVFFVVKTTFYNNLDKDLSFEANKHTTEIFIENDSIKIINKEEWAEREHKEIQVNPVFIQIIDKNGNLMDKSPNLKSNRLPFRENHLTGGHFNELLNNEPIRQAQVPVVRDGEIKGYILAAMSLESFNMVINKLQWVLFLSYLVVLVFLYNISKFLADRSIRPIKEMTGTTQRITNKNFNERVSLPTHKDELYELASNFNELLQRIEDTLERERQFTSDASHELRTPLSVLRGTLEVLIRRQRTPEEYQEKVRYVLSEIDRMSNTIDQLLLLARNDLNQNANKNLKISLPTAIDEILVRYKNQITEKKIKVNVNFDLDNDYSVPNYYTHLILENIIRNAIKYSRHSSVIDIFIFRDDHKIVCKIKDKGIGIGKDDLNKLFNYFYRAESLNPKEFPGDGLGLSIVKKAADAIKAELQVDSQLGIGTVFTIIF